jgi:hypothetical protein
VGEEEPTDIEEVHGGQDMTDRSTWKKQERRVADYFGSRRNPLSGINSAHSASDSLHERLFIECKLRANVPVIRIWEDAKKDAVKEGKTPIVCLSEKNKKGFWVLIHSEDLKKVHEELQKLEGMEIPQDDSNDQ